MTLLLRMGKINYIIVAPNCLLMLLHKQRINDVKSASRYFRFLHFSNSIFQIRLYFFFYENY